MNSKKLYQLAHSTLLSLATDDGIMASGRNEVYGCIFGRDSAITILKILKAHEVKPSLPLLEISRRALLNLTKLQGKEVNLESGEEPGKFIHEFRPTDYERLLTLDKPWYVYPDGVLRNYDSIDSTPLALIAIHKYWQISQDEDFLKLVLPSVTAGLNWILNFADRDGDYIVEYELPEQRAHGGLVVQSWTDSHESLTQADGSFPKYPIAPVEVQGYCWLALKIWSDYFTKENPEFANKLNTFARKMQDTFNIEFAFKDQGLSFFAQALDGEKNQIRTITGNPLLCLWAAYQTPEKTECIIYHDTIKDVVKRAFLPDLFVKQAGIRTMSALSPTFNPRENSYHNGSFWPVLNGMIVEGLENFGFKAHTKKLKQATLQPIKHFGSPIELYVKTDSGYSLYKELKGQAACLEQAWSAASLLHLTSRA